METSDNVMRSFASTLARIFQRSIYTFAIGQDHPNQRFHASGVGQGQKRKKTCLLRLLDSNFTARFSKRDRQDDSFDTPRKTTLTGTCWVSLLIELGLRPDFL